MPAEYTVITGASSGIGRAAAGAFAARGSNLVLAARRLGRLEALRDQLCREHPGTEILVRAADLSVPGAAEDLYAELSGLPILTWINNAGRGFYGQTASQDVADLRGLLELDVQSVAVLSTLFVRDCRDRTGAQLINVSSAGGYVNVPTAVTYCAAKFFVSAFTEGLAWELRRKGSALRAKVFAPAATATEFGRRANRADRYDYSRAFPRFHTPEEAAGLLLRLYDSDAAVGFVDREDFSFRLSGPRLPYAGGSSGNQRP